MDQSIEVILGNGRHGHVIGELSDRSVAHVGGPGVESPRKIRWDRMRKLQHGLLVEIGLPWVFTLQALPAHAVEVLVSDGRTITLGSYDKNRRGWDIPAPGDMEVVNYWCPLTVPNWDGGSR